MSPTARSISIAKVHIRRVSLPDLEAILGLERATLTAPHWPLATYSAILEQQGENAPKRSLFVAESLDQTATESAIILGFAVGLMHPAEATAELETIAVAAPAQRAGIGRALCTAVLDWGREQGATSTLLEARATSAAAIALYMSLGFILEGRRRHYYRDPTDDALILRLQQSRAT